MEEKQKLTKVLAAGALLLMQPNTMDRPKSQRGTEKAYQDLKQTIQEKYQQVDVDILARGPGSAERQEMMAEQLENAGVTNDKEILRQAQHVLELIREESPSLLWAAEPAETPAHLQ